MGPMSLETDKQPAGPAQRARERAEAEAERWEDEGGFVRPLPVPEQPTEEGPPEPPSRERSG